MYSKYIYVVMRDTTIAEPVVAFNDRERAKKYADDHENQYVVYIPYEEILKNVENTNTETY